MFISDIDAEGRSFLRSGRGYLILAAAVLVGGLVYEHFSFGVLSVFMLGAWLIPLLCGCVPNGLWAHRVLPRPETGVRRLLLAGIATWTVGSLLQGALEIYGTTNRLMAVYAAAGAALLAASAAAYVRGLLRARAER